MDEIKLQVTRNICRFGFRKIWLEAYYKGILIDRRKMFGPFPTRFFEKRLKWRLGRLKRYAEILVRNSQF